MSLSHHRRLLCHDVKMSASFVPHGHGATYRMDARLALLRPCGQLWNIMQVLSRCPQSPQAGVPTRSKGKSGWWIPPPAQCATQEEAKDSLAPFRKTAGVDWIAEKECDAGGRPSSRQRLMAAKTRRTSHRRWPRKQKPGIDRKCRKAKDVSSVGKLSRGRGAGKTPRLQVGEKGRRPGIWRSALDIPTTRSKSLIGSTLQKPSPREKEDF